MISSTFLFALMNVMVKMLEGIPSHEIVLFRSVITLLITLYLMRRKNIAPLGKSHRLIMVGRGVAGSIALLIFFYTIKHLPLATAVTVAYLSPIFTIIFSSVLLREHVNWKQWMFFAISFTGIVFINGIELNEDTSIVLLGVLGASCSGLAYNALRKTAGFVDPLVVVFYLPLITIPVITPFCVQHWVTPHGWEWILLLGVGIVTQFAQLNMTKAYQMEKAGAIANWAYLGVVFALIFGYLIFEEHYDMAAIFGMLIVVAGIIANFLYVNRVTSAKRFKAYFRGFPGL
ncbi:MAG: DMT family transporter [Bacteroidetes bacterium]|nr:DMT family transporter [Bacteroidota bacterium]